MEYYFVAFKWTQLVWKSSDTEGLFEIVTIDENLMTSYFFKFDFSFLLVCDQHLYPQSSVYMLYPLNNVDTYNARPLRYAGKSTPI